MRKPFALAWPLCLFLLFAAPTGAQENGPPGSRPEPSRWESNHSIVVGGETVEYDAVVASTTLTNADGEAALPQWKETLDGFILRTSGRTAPVSQ